MTSTAGPTLPAGGGRRRNLLDLTSREWGRPQRQGRNRRPWMIAAGGLAFSSLLLGAAAVVLDHRRPAP